MFSDLMMLVNSALAASSNYKQLQQSKYNVVQVKHMMVQQWEKSANIHELIKESIDHIDEREGS